MSDNMNVTDADRLLQRLARSAATPAEKSFVTTPGDRTFTAAAKVISQSLQSYHIRMIRTGNMKRAPVQRLGLIFDNSLSFRHLRRLNNHNLIRLG